ncbi:hypothetical protein [Streptomyces sp. NPDC095613]|uniref:hypothetical protein n=1 Tax=Streptomyces sp. NPDC095613 TaxID=3155540 RepID=UPI00331A08FF
MPSLAEEVARLRREVAQIKKGQRLAHGASIEDAAIEVRDGTGGLRAIVGQQGDGTTAVNIVNGGPPPAPSAPAAGTALGGIVAGWDGMFADGAVIPLDWARVEVHAAPAPDFTPSPDTLQATIETAQGGIVYVSATGPLYVRLLARNTSGTASAPTEASGPYAPRPVAGDIGIGEITETLIADGAITTPKVYANAITTGKLAAGSVDATALKADAITGKVITGGTINGAEFHSDDGAGGLVDISSGKVISTAPNNWRILIDPTQIYSVIGVIDGNSNVAGAINGTGDNDKPALNISSGAFTDGAITDWRWVTVLGSDGVTNGWTTKRVRNSDTNVTKGGYFDLTPVQSRIGFRDNTTPGTASTFTVSLGQATLGSARLYVDVPPSSNSGIYLTADAAHTGPLLRARFADSDRFIVSTAGTVSAVNFTASGSVTAGTLTVAGKDAGLGLITSVSRISNLTNISTTSLALMTTPSMTWRDGRTYSVHLVGLMNSSTANTYALYQVVKGTTASGSVIRGQIRMPLAATANTHQEFTINVSNTTGADITTAITVTVSAAAGTGQFSASPPTPAYITVTDLGLATDWPGTPLT